MDSSNVGMRQRGQNFRLDDTHSAAAQLLRDLVVGYLLADHLRNPRPILVQAGGEGNRRRTLYLGWRELELDWREHRP